MGKKDFTFFEAALMVARRFPKVYLSTSNTAPEFLVRAVREIGPSESSRHRWKRTNPGTPFDDQTPSTAPARPDRGSADHRRREGADPGKNLERLLAEVRG